MLRFHFPQFLQANSVALRLTLGVQAELLDDLLGQVAATAFGEHRAARVQFHAAGEVVLGRSVLGDAVVLRRDTFDAAVVVIENFRRSIAGIDFHSERFRLLAEPSYDVAQADDVVALVVHRPARDYRDRESRCLREKRKFVVGDGCVERCAEFLPVGDQLGEGDGIKASAGQYVGSNFTRLLDNAHADLLALFACQLFGSDRSRQSRRARSDDQQVCFVHKPLHVHILPPSVLLARVDGVMCRYLSIISLLQHLMTTGTNWKKVRITKPIKGQQSRNSRRVSPLPTFDKILDIVTQLLHLRQV